MKTPPKIRRPRLIRHMQATALLTPGEAECAIRAHARGDEYACEAVAHFGGTSAVLSAAIGRRHERKAAASRD